MNSGQVFDFDEDGVEVVRRVMLSAERKVRLLNLIFSSLPYLLLLEGCRVKPVNKEVNRHCPFSHRFVRVAWIAKKYQYWFDIRVTLGKDGARLLVFVTAELFRPRKKESLLCRSSTDVNGVDLTPLLVPAQAAPENRSLWIVGLPVIWRLSFWRVSDWESRQICQPRKGQLNIITVLSVT